MPAAGRLALWGSDDPVTEMGELGLPAGEPGQLVTVLPAEGGEPVPVTVPARYVPVLPAVRALAVLPTVGDWPSWRRPSDSVLGWTLAAKLALEFVAGGRIVPTVAPSSRTAAVVAHWRAAPPRDGRLARLAEALPAAAHALRSGDGTATWSAEDLLAAFCDAVADACAREGRRPEDDPRRGRTDLPWDEAWPAALSGSDPYAAVRRRPDDLVAAAAAWLDPVLGHDRLTLARLALRLEAPAAETVLQRDDRTGVGGTWTLHLLLQAAQAPDAVAPAREVWAAGGEPIELGDRRVDAPQDALVLGLAEAGEIFEPLRTALREPRPESLLLDAADAAALLDLRDELETAGIGVLLPAELDAIETRRLRPRVRVGSKVHDPGDVTGEVSGLFTAGALSQFRFEIALGDDRIDPEELARLAALGERLVRWNDQWVRIDRDEVDDLAELAGTGGQLQLVEALVAALAGQHAFVDGRRVETVADGEVAALIEHLRADRGPVEPRLERFVGTLRPYQGRAVAWLQTHADLGLGAVLADEMGLGKTPTAIALLASRTPDRPHLVVCPTSVVGNWERELHRFAPDVPVVRYHGADRPRRFDAFRPGSVAVTSYALLRRDIGFLEAVPWDTVVYDEVQQIKNVASKGAKAARALDTRVRLAMTGTPVENRLSELWAIIDLTNPGLLGPLRRFAEHYAVPIERWGDQEAATRLRRLIAPFVMRREKSDPAISVDLPEKQEVTVACSLTREQAALYQAAVEDAFAGGKLAGEGFGRKGRVLALLTALKQVCNHPAHYLGEDGPLRGRSGKLARTTEILEEIVASGDHALLFTQYRKMGDLLQRHLHDALDLPEVPFLHGGVRAHLRDRMVERFQEDEDAPPVLIVSLRAGGTGLNLTRATEVIHFDRWWNPAVEDQAADRAHRIGQTRPVTVHTLVAAGTVEDRIAELLERKRQLADAVVGAGETWITEMGEDDLRELVALSSDDVEDEFEEGAA